ncbi:MULTISPECIES: iron-sulfur cluster assembly scaffold protein [Sphingomonas]|uniref:Iron-sulfur cluster assembly scaffold protein n=1 Tax=Sphingomonas adhaesiva TaxID=28212 RepID=A0A2A4I9J6_9SPHN|nr:MULTISPECIES: iron-sulfur cluster assembly scaffold protein [Sphingomonas]PCG15647.1 iron-sulfur cluster assembly scaffold protein [Sphingomonas adhaesiva]PZU76149.1 MAG: iron-sulfur cluster assembly scaffold protein [Sphingomonas sp.]
MSLDLYTPDVSALAVGNPYPERLAGADGSAERRSPICGSRVAVDVALGDDGRVAMLGTQVRACLLGQASATLMARHAIGRTPAELAAARDELTAWLAGEGAVPAWPGLDVFTPGLRLTARHPSIRLAFEAAAEAADAAQRTRDDRTAERTGA